MEEIEKFKIKKKYKLKNINNFEKLKKEVEEKEKLNQEISQLNSKSEEERNIRTKEIKEQIEKMELTFKNNLNDKEEEIKKLNDDLFNIKSRKRQ